MTARSDLPGHFRAQLPPSGTSAGQAAGAVRSGSARRPGPLTTSRPQPVPTLVTDRWRTWVRCALDLQDDTTVQVSQHRCRHVDCAPVVTVLAVLRPGAPLARTIALPAAQICATDVLHAFDDRPPTLAARSTL